MSHIVAPDGSPMDTAVIGAESIAKSRTFYEDVVGLTALDEGNLAGSIFENYWHLPEGSTASYLFLGAGPDPVGRVLLIEFDAADRQLVRSPGTHRAYGLFNLNFYTNDIVADYDRLTAEGYNFWSRPVQHELGDDVGLPIEVVFDGPDSVAMNLVELATEDPETRIGQMRQFVDQYGRTSTGYTPVVTTSHVMSSLDKAQRFYESVLQMGVLIDDKLSSPESNDFLMLPPDSVTLIKFFQGNHMYGKIAASYPDNYVCDDLTPNAIAPNIGYLAQSFRVRDLDRSVAAIEKLNAEVYSAPVEINLPGRGACRAMIVRNPGSNALQEIFQPIA